MGYKRFVVNGEKMAKKKTTKRSGARKSTKATRSAAAKKAARTRATNKAARSRAAKKGAKTRAKRNVKKRPKNAAKKTATKRNKKPRAAKKAAKKTVTKRPKKAVKKTATKRNKKPTAKQLAARAKFTAMVKAKAKARARTKANPAGLTAPAKSVPQYRKKKKTTKKARGITPAATPAQYRRAAVSALARLKDAERRCDAALKKMRSNLAVTKAEVTALKGALAKSERTIKAFEKTIGRLEGAPKTKAKADLQRLKARQRETAQLTTRTVQYYNTRDKKGRSVKRVRKGGKTWAKSPETRKPRCPPKTKRAGAKLQAGKSAGGKAVADARWCGGVKTSVVKRNFWNLKEELI
jgi:hypothetical protein